MRVTQLYRGKLFLIRWEGDTIGNLFICAIYGTERRSASHSRGVRASTVPVTTFWRVVHFGGIQTATLHHGLLPAPLLPILYPIRGI
jgi:hypothetical protein